MVFFGIVATVWYFLELFRQCGIFWNCSDSVVFLEFFRQCGIFWNCSDSVVFFVFHFIGNDKYIYITFEINGVCAV